MEDEPSEMAEILDLAASSMTSESNEPVKEKRGPGRPPKKKRGPGRPPKNKRGPGRPPKEKRGPGRPPKKKSTSTAKPSQSKKSSGRGPGRPPKGSHTFTYTTQNGEKHELGEWDQLVIKSIHEAKQPLINSELLEISMKSPLGQKLGEEDAKLMISRTIHKLVNRKPILKKVGYDGRGNAYATEGMVDPKGNVKKDFQRK